MSTLGLSRLSVLRRLLSRLLRRRQPVPAGPGRDPRDEGGSAGVREPRRPRPHGPQSGAAARELPREEQQAVLPDPRH
ncbi:MAG TPA: hypothetical protein VFQ77_14535 [Pseudonocardiaceae bacterium]|nr:hypothetical protein [Pseudonocardiaceae bacterium]